MIKIDFRKETKRVSNFWNNIHFHPTDAIEDEWGQVILNKVANDRVADTIRMHVMLEDIVSRDKNGCFSYDYTLIDRRLDFLLGRGFTPTLCFFAMPPCIAENPEGWGSSHATGATRYKGKRICASPPKDYADWEEICYQTAHHLILRYGIDEVKKWDLQCYNEPDMPGFWMSDAGERYDPVAVNKRMEAYIKLYAAFAAGMDRADPTLRIGGVSLASNLDFLEGFLSFLKETGTHADFICVHAYGAKPDKAQAGETPLSAESVPGRVREYAALVRKYFPDEKDLIMDEWGMMSRGFCNRHHFPITIARETSAFAAYMGKMLARMIADGPLLKKLIICLSGQHEMTEEFTGYRGFFTLNGIPKPIYHAYRLCRKLGEQFLKAESENPDLAVLATREGENLSILLAYAQEHFEEDYPDLKDTLTINGLEGDYQVTTWKIDQNHACPYTLFKKEEMPIIPDEEQREHLMKASELIPEQSVVCANGKLELPIACTTNALLLLELKKA